MHIEKAKFKFKAMSCIQSLERSIPNVKLLEGIFSPDIGEIKIEDLFTVSVKAFLQF